MLWDTYINLSGASAIAGGVVGVMRPFLPPPFQSMSKISGLLTLVGLMGVLLLLSRRGTGGWGWTGFTLALGGNLLFVLERFEAVGGLLYAAGLLAVAMGAWKSGAFPMWAPMLWLGTALMGALGLFLPGSEGSLTTMATILFGLSFIAAGHVLWNTETVEAAASWGRQPGEGVGGV